MVRFRLSIWNGPNKLALLCRESGFFLCLFIRFLFVLYFLERAAFSVGAPLVQSSRLGFPALMVLSPDG